jgi:hypothetical protein
MYKQQTKESLMAAPTSTNNENDSRDSLNNSNIATPVPFQSTA